jgi:hypothetical protein
MIAGTNNKDKIIENKTRALTIKSFQFIIKKGVIHRGGGS